MSYPLEPASVWQAARMPQLRELSQLELALSLELPPFSGVTYYGANHFVNLEAICATLPPPPFFCKCSFQRR